MICQISLKKDVPLQDPTVLLFYVHLSGALTIVVKNNHIITTFSSKRKSSLLQSSMKTLLLQTQTIATTPLAP
jgi:hypothetical protein